MSTIIDNVKKTYKEKFYLDNPLVFSCGGRFEILGNHTDHNHGLCLAATCNLSIYAAVMPADNNKVIVYSKGYKPDFINLDNLKPVQGEKGTSKALVCGVAEYLVSHGYKIGGFTMTSESEIFPGAGISSSAAFELLIAQIFNELFNENKIPRLLMCKAGQYAENKYFGKASGLLDQIGVGYGNISYIDFKDIENPKVENIGFPFDDLHFVIINTGGSHANLSHLYSAIPQDMFNAAKKLGDVNFLRDLKDGNIDKSKLTEMEYKRALHFFSENERVKQAIDAINSKDQKSFLDAINDSCKSSTENLKNMMVENEYEGSPLEACDLFHKICEEGAIKINGGGFRGSVIAVVPTKSLNKVLSEMGKKYGKNNIKEVCIRPTGPTKLLK